LPFHSGVAKAAMPALRMMSNLRMPALRMTPDLERILRAPRLGGAVTAVWLGLFAFVLFEFARP